MGVGFGAILFGDGDDSRDEVRELQEDLRASQERAEELEQEINQRKDPFPIATAVTEFAAEDSGWDPCGTTGLCEFVEQVDSAFRAGDTDRILNLIRWTPVDCEKARALPSEAFGVVPIQCLDWPFQEDLPTVAMGLDQSEGGPVPRWGVRSDIQGRFAETNGLCFGTQYGVIAVVESPNPEFVYAGEAAALVGPPPDTCPLVRKYHVAFARDGAGQWAIQGFVTVRGLGLIDRPDGRELYVSKFRYWPLK